MHPLEPFIYPAFVCIRRQLLKGFDPVSTISSRSTCATPHRCLTTTYTFICFFQGFFAELLYRIHLGPGFFHFLKGVCQTVPKVGTFFGPPLDSQRSSRLGSPAPASFPVQDEITNVNFRTGRTFCLGIDVHFSLKTQEGLPYSHRL